MYISNTDKEHSEIVVAQLFYIVLWKNMPQSLTEGTCEHNFVFWIHLQEFWEAWAVAKTKSTLLLSISPSALLQWHGVHTWYWMIHLLWVALHMSVCTHFSGTRQLNKVLITNIVSSYNMILSSFKRNLLKSLERNQSSVNGCKGNWGWEKKAGMHLHS